MNAPLHVLFPLSCLVESKFSRTLHTEMGLQRQLVCGLSAEVGFSVCLFGFVAVSEGDFSVLSNSGFLSSSASSGVSRSGSGGELGAVGSARCSDVGPWYGGGGFRSPLGGRQSSSVTLTHRLCTSEEE